MNNCDLIGRLVRDVELKFIPSTGMAVAKFTIAVDKNMSKDKKDQAKQQGKPTANFIPVTVFGKSAENCANYLFKGSQCAVQGEFNTGSYTKEDGTKVYTSDILASRVEFLSKKETNNTQSGNGRPVEFPDDENDIFQPVADDDIPF